MPNPAATLSLQHASTQLQEGFDHYYDAMVQVYLQHFRGLLSYSEFANRTARAKAPLNDLTEAVFYTIGYASHHFDCLSHAFSHVVKREQAPTNHTPRVVNVIDYGCGQALASIALLQRLAALYEEEQHLLTFQVHLVEPSATTLQIAADLVAQVAIGTGLNVEIHTHQKDIATFLRMASQQHCSMPSMTASTVHLFSNVLDIRQVQQSIPALGSYFDAIDASQIVIAVGPRYPDTTNGMQQLMATQSTATTKKVKAFAIDSSRYSVLHQSWQTRTIHGNMLLMQIAHQPS